MASMAARSPAMLWSLAHEFYGDIAGGVDALQVELATREKLTNPQRPRDPPPLSQQLADRRVVGVGRVLLRWKPGREL